MNFPYNWKLSNGFPASGIDYHGLTVFTCFAGGGGSSMGYKLAGYNVIGFNEIDEKQANCYEQNLGKIEFRYLEDIRKFRTRKNLPKELFNLDILDGSPPCTSFSIAGNREKDWGKEKKFREGQVLQTLDDLLFEYIKLGKRLMPKVILLENVKGLILGNAIKYLAQICIFLNKMGYYTIWRVLNSKNMGVPQARERIFLLALRKDLVSQNNIPLIGMLNPEPKINLQFNNQIIPFSKIDEGIDALKKPSSRKLALDIGTKTRTLWDKTKPGNSFAKVTQGSFFNSIKIHPNLPLPTITGSCHLLHYNIPRKLSDNELKLGGTFPIDYDFMKYRNDYIIGMSVPPVMITQIAHRIYEQWLSKIK